MNFTITDNTFPFYDTEMTDYYTMNFQFTSTKGNNYKPTSISKTFDIEVNRCVVADFTPSITPDISFDLNSYNYKIITLGTGI